MSVAPTSFGAFIPRTTKRDFNLQSRHLVSQSHKEHFKFCIRFSLVIFQEEIRKDELSGLHRADFNQIKQTGAAAGTW